MVDIQITYQCNNNCLSCIIPEKAYCKEKVEKDDVIRLLDDENPEIIAIGGGEPSIDPDFFDILRFAAEKNPEAVIKILSNGRYFFYEESVKKLLKVIKGNDNKFEVHISIYGTEKVHEKITRSKNSFKQTLKGIKNLLDSGIEVNLRIIVNRQNYRNLNELSDMIVEDLDNINKIIFIFSRYMGKAQKNIEEVSVKYDESVEYVQEAIDILQKGFKGVIRLYHFPTCVLDPEYRSLVHGMTKESGGVTFLDICSECIFKNDCSGIWESYIERFGDKEFEPLNP